MDDILKRKVIEEIKKSGFPLEIDLVNHLRQEGFLTFANLSFQDENANPHEIDILSIIFSEENEWKHGPSGVQLIVECKKTDKYPWLFFDEGYNPLTLLGKLPKVDYSTDFLHNGKEINILTGCMNSALANHHYNNASIPSARVYLEVFRKPTDLNNIYKALNSLFHAGKYIRTDFIKRNKFDPKNGRAFLNHYAIVLDGNLLIARKNDIDDYDIEEVNHIVLTTVDTVDFTSQSLLGDELIIDIIRKEYFQEYISLLQKTAYNFNKHLINILETGFIDIL